MTIKEFARLCGCTTQTLRYYDHQNLLKPVRVDDSSGYRYYDKDQALTFVKIKNLQKAGFLIEEIKELLDKSDIEIYYAFEAKLKEAELRIEEIRSIQKTYQSEVSDMTNKIETVKDLLEEALESYDPFEEFGINESSYLEAVGMFNSLLDQIIEDGDPSRFEFNEYKDGDAEKEETYIDNCLNNPDYEVIFEKHNWVSVRCFYHEIPELNEENGYLLLFKVNSHKHNKTMFANTIIGMCLKDAGCRLKIGCTVVDSRDDFNHFWLVKYKDIV